MLDAALRTLKDTALAPLAGALGPRMPPALLTLAGLAAGLAAALTLWRGQLAAGLLLWALNRTLDGLDGALARRFGRQSDWGGYLDILCDFAVYATIPIGLAMGRAEPALMLPLAAMLAAFYLNAASWMYLAALLSQRTPRAAAPGVPTSIPMPGGLIEGTETILLYALFILFPDRLAPLFLLTAALVLFTVGQRVVWARGALR